MTLIKYEENCPLLKKYSFGQISIVFRFYLTEDFAFISVYIEVSVFTKNILDAVFKIFVAECGIVPIVFSILRKIC